MQGRAADQGGTRQAPERARRSARGSTHPGHVLLALAAIGVVTLR